MHFLSYTPLSPSFPLPSYFQPSPSRNYGLLFYLSNSVYDAFKGDRVVEILDAVVVRYACGLKAAEERRRLAIDAAATGRSTESSSWRRRSAYLQTSSHYGTKPGHFETSLIHFPTSEGVSSGGRKRSEQSGASERLSGASERANGRASGPVLQSVFLVVLSHSGAGFFRHLDGSQGRRTRSEA